MRKRSHHSIALAGAIAAWYCAAALTQTTAQDTARPQADPNPARCAGLTGLQRSECERRDSTEELPAGVTQGQMERKAQRVAEASRDAQARPSSAEARRTPSANARANAPANAADTMRAPPTSVPATSTTTPAATAPPPASTPRDDADTLNRPRE